MSLLGDLEARFGDLTALFHPGGDTGAIFAAARATRTLASDLRDTATSLDLIAAEMEKSWHGLGDKADETAAGKFQSAWSKFSKAIVGYAGQLDTDAAAIEKQGEALQNLQSQAVKLDWIAGLTAGTFVIVGVLTGGIGAELEFEMAANEIAVAAGVMTEMEATIANALLLLGNAIQVVTPLAAQFVLGAFADGAALVWEKKSDHENPLNMDTWTPNDVTNVLLGGEVSLVWGVLTKVPALSFLDKTANWNATAAIAWAIPWEFWIQGQPFDWHTFQTILESGAISYVSAPFYKYLGKAIPALGRVLNDQGETTIPGVTKSDVANNLISIPITGEKLYFVTGGPEFRLPGSPAAGAQTPSAPVPQLPAPAVLAVPPHIGGGTETVKPGDSLYAVSARTLGNANLYPVLQAANPLMVGPNGEIFPGQKLLIPVLPPVPQGSTAQVVQPGESLSDFAGGNPQVERQIAELNGLKNENLIYPGQVLIVPPAG